MIPEQQFQEDLEIVDSKDIKLEMALQLLAVFVHRFGGEVIINKREFEFIEGVDVVAKHISSEQLRLKLNDGCDGCELCDGE
jgi:hypothetical protein